ncbi:MAG: flavodoxin-dependent (E)-4-hydroxy-3-methylbut-2-enyl-diphosphate synthase [Chloroflexi bacterium]|nr:flavodoxin-dependent (E)-4-hydroxy-3-methylbut-2-enyl-diphosphate synthase [Chloroflexota bacterium]
MTVSAAGNGQPASPATQPARRQSRAIRVGNVTIGGGAPVVVQSMTSTDTRDVAATLSQVLELEAGGCEVVRVAVPDGEAARAVAELKSRLRPGPPIIADIHFDYRLALEALAAGADGLRLNPGNIRDPDKIAQVAREARARGVPIRVGANAGSLPAAQATGYGLQVPEVGSLEPEDRSPEPVARSLSQRLVAAALAEVQLLEALDFDQIKVSLKAFDVPTTVEAYRTIAPLIPYPLHLGITEAGPPPSGLVRSAVGLGILLGEGIGDTIRVSLTAHPREEVRAAYEILKALGLREHGPVLISCPTCGRTEADIIGLAETVSRLLGGLDKPLKVAIMGCVVNGPGEAREADVGLACGKGKGVLFRKGERVRVVPEGQYLEVLLAEIAALSSHNPTSGTATQ